MRDSWPKLLARANWVEGHWSLLDSTESGDALVDQATRELRNIAAEAASQFNAHTLRKQQLAVMDTAEGFRVLAGQWQLAIKVTGHILHADLVTTRSFREEVSANLKFRAWIDAFGSLRWQGSDSLLCDNELVIKRLFEELVRATLVT